MVSTGSTGARNLGMRATRKSACDAEPVRPGRLPARHRKAGGYTRLDPIHAHPRAGALRGLGGSIDPVFPSGVWSGREHPYPGAVHIRHVLMAIVCRRAVHTGRTSEAPRLQPLSNCGPHWIGEKSAAAGGLDLSKGHLT